MSSKKQKSNGTMHSKVKEMQSQQQTWFKQRQLAQGRSSSEPQKTSTANSTASSTVSSSRSSASPQPRAGLNYLPQKYTSSSPQARPGNAHVTSRAEPEPAMFHVTSGNHSARSLSPEQFDAVANNIISRVKQQLRMPEAGTEAGSERPQAHFCPACDNVMSDVTHAPMLTEPCAHSLCRACALHTSVCPCGARVCGAARNTALLHLIQKWQRSSQQREDHLQDEAAERAKKQERLRLRLEVLSAEESELRRRLTEADEDQRAANKTVLFIQDETRVVEEELERLQTRLLCLADDQQQAETEVEKCRNRRGVEQGKLDVLLQAINELHVQIHEAASTVS